jgi:hypothetical protein
MCRLPLEETSMTDRPTSALRQLRGGVLPVLDAQSEQARRERIAGRVLSLSRQLSTRAERRRRFGLGVAIAALVGACAVVLYLGLIDRSAPVALTTSAEIRLVAGHASLRTGARTSPIENGQLALPSDAVLVTQAREGAELRLSSETALSVAPATEVGITRRQPTLDGFEERVRLRAGSVALRVPRLGSHGKVSVETGDALIEVHGTQFSVRVVERPPLEPFTEVQVREGRVLVRSGEQSRFLGAGDAWSSRDDQRSKADAPLPPAPIPAAEPELAPEPAPVKRASAVRKARATDPVVASELAAQNRLLEAAELAQKSGMPTLALQRLEELITRYPDAELAHNARVERFRVLGLAGRDAEAVAAAQVYIDRHPGGFARQEAERLIEALSPSP